MNEITATLADAISYKPPMLYDYNSCSEYVLADKQYWADKLSKLALLAGLGTSGACYIDNSFGDSSLIMRTSKSIGLGLGLGVGMKLFSYIFVGWKASDTESMCIEGAKQYSNFQDFAQAQKIL